MKKKGFMVSGILFGLVFIALGVFLLLLDGDSKFILIVAIVDALFGLLLIISGITSGRNNAAKNPVQANRQRGSWDEPPVIGGQEMAAATVAADEPAYYDARSSAPQPAPEQYASPDYESMSDQELAAEEQRLRSEARSANAEARIAVDEAKAAIEKAKRADQDVRRAEQNARELAGVEQQNAMREVDQLGQTAYELAQDAAAAKERAVSLRNRAQKLTDEHSRVVEIAASRMDDDF